MCNVLSGPYRYHVRVAWYDAISFIRCAIWYQMWWPPVLADLERESVSPLGLMFKTPSEASLTSKTTSVMLVHNSKSPKGSASMVETKFPIHF